jgi:hypothetical protein
MRKLDDVIKKTDQLLYQMIPKAVAERLRSALKKLNCKLLENAKYPFNASQYLG